MKRGLKVTLMTVATAMLGLQAMAMAPVISEIPSPIVGGSVTATGTTPFVFGDALDLNTYVTDDVNTPDQIKWSYAIAGTPKYSINGDAPIDLATDDPNNPAAAKQINATVAAQETVNPDGKANTITIRNINLTPFTGTGAAPSGTGLIDSQMVTLYASDGQAYSSTTLMFYSDNGGSNRLSGNILSATNVRSRSFSGSTQSWVWDSPVGAASSSTAGGICIASPMTNGGMGSWTSPYGEIPTLVDNAVYRIRATMNFTQAQAGAKVPFWDVNIQNYQYANGVSHGANLFGGGTYYFDTEGDANAISSTHTNFEMWWCPVPIQTAYWKSNALTAANSNDMQGMIQFRVIDLEGDSTAGITPATKGGTICLSNLTVDRVDITQLAAPSNMTEVYSKSSFTKNVDANVAYFFGSTADFTGGTIKLTPSASGQTSEYMTVTPGDTNFTVNDPASIPDNFPVTWEANTLYMVTANLSAPDAASQNNPWDAFWLSMDSPTNEVISESYVTGALSHAGMPRTGTPQTYTTFYYGSNGSNTAINHGKTLRPKFAIGNNTNLNWNTNSGSVVLHSWAVNKIKTLPQ